MCETDIVFLFIPWVKPILFLSINNEGSRYCLLYILWVKPILFLSIYHKWSRYCFPLYTPSVYIPCSRYCFSLYIMSEADIIFVYIPWVKPILFFSIYQVWSQYSFSLYTMSAADIVFVYKPWVQLVIFLSICSTTAPTLCQLIVIRLHFLLKQTINIPISWWLSRSTYVSGFAFLCMDTCE